MEYTTINIFGAMIEYFALYAFLWIFFERHPQRKLWRCSCHVLMPILFFLFATYVSNIYLRPTLFIICSWFIAAGFMGNLWLRVFSVTVFQIILIFIEIITTLYLSSLLINSFETFYLSTNIFVKLVTLSIVLLLFLFSKRKRFIFAHLNRQDSIMLLLLSTMSFFFVVFTEYLLRLIDKPALYAVGCFGIVLCIFVNISLYYLFYRLSVGEEAKAKLQFLNVHLSQQKDVQTQLEQNYRQIRKLSHDMKHYLAAIATLLEHNQLDEAKTELQKQQQLLDQTPLFDTGYTVLNSVLTYKFQEAQNRNIQPQLYWNIHEPLQVNVTDLSVILANGLDNAIEAASQVKQAKAFLTVHAELTDGYIKLRICNNTATDPIIRNGTIATTKQDKQLHGLGLQSIKALCQQYQGDSSVTCENHLFTLAALLKNTPCSS